MKLFIPELGTKIKLTQNWIFPLHAENKNKGAYMALVKMPLIFDWTQSVTTSVTLPVGTILIVDRIYIRRGTWNGVNISSVSFWALHPEHKKKFRFWAKLVDVNQIECEVQL
jgi:hypothetical protein